MPKRFGDFIPRFPPDHDSLELTFTPFSKKIKHRWRSQRLSAHFLADYFVNFAPEKEPPFDEEQWIHETKSTVSYVGNELLENAMKFSAESSNAKVKLGIHFLDDSALVAVIFATNLVHSAEAEKLQMFIHQLLASNPEDFYIQQVEASTEDESADLSGLGLLTMINDYHAKLGWELDTVPSHPDLISVTTMAQIDL